MNEKWKSSGRGLNSQQVDDPKLCCNAITGIKT